MPGDWVVMRSDLEQDPAVFHIAKRLKCARRTVLGHLHACWAFFDRVSRDGHAHSVTASDLDELVGVAGLAKAMQTTPESPWLTVADDGHVVMPDFDIWLSQSAKRRLLAMKRQRRYRERQHQESNGVRDDDVTQKRDHNVTRVSVSVLEQQPLGPAVPVAENGHGSPGSKPKKQPKPPDPEAAEIAAGLAKLIARFDPERSPARLRRVTSPASVEEIRRLIQVDGRKPEDVRDLLVWLFRNEAGDYQGTESFDWRTVIQGGQSLRKSWDQIAPRFRAAFEESPS